jgi:Sec-independent protein translocase protein TatA
MNILGVGPLELVIIVLILLLILGPEDLEKTGKTVGKWINKLTKSEGWMAVTRISRELRGLPARLAREAELESLRDEFNFDNQIGSTPLFEEAKAEKTSAAPSSDDESAGSAPETSAPPPQDQETEEKEKSE